MESDAGCAGAQAGGRLGPEPAAPRRLARRPGWCSAFCANALIHAGVKGVDWRLASVANIEDDAKPGRGPFRAWTKRPGGVLRGDLVVLFGRGVHVELVERIDGGVVHTIGGNTSAGSVGSQSNGGGVYRRPEPPPHFGPPSDALNAEKLGA